MAGLKNPLIFIVEDNKIYNRLVVEFLKKNRYTNVMPFDSGEECLKNVGQKPDIIIQDYLLGGMNGIEVLRRVKKLSPKTEFLFLSGQESMEVAVNTMRYGAFDYIVKDQVTLDKVVDRINKILKIKRLERTNFQIKAFMAGFIVFLLLVILFFVIYYMTDILGVHW